MVRVREGAAVYFAEVLSSARLQDGVEIELAFADKGRRREKRISASGPATVKLSTAMGDAIRAEVVNVSACGIGLLCDRAIGTGETVRVVGEDVEKLCRVRRCLTVAGGYRAGLQFCDGIENGRGH